MTGLSIPKRCSDVEEDGRGGPAPLLPRRERIEDEQKMTSATGGMEAKKSTNRSHLVVISIGVLLGLLIYQFFDYRALYWIVGNGQYLTVTQPRLAQSLDEIATPFPPAPTSKVLIIGGSAAYHSVSEDYIESQLREAGIETDVGLVSFSSQSFTDILAMIEALPKRDDVTDSVLLAWSFWRFDGTFLDDFKQYFSFNRNFFRSSFFEQRLRNGDYDELIKTLTKYDDWSTLSEAEGLPSRGRMATWISYFLLDKVQKMQSGRWAYFFKDPPAFIQSSRLQPVALQRYRDTLENIDHESRLKKQLITLDKTGTFDFQEADEESVASPEVIIESVLSFVSARLQEKGYRFILYELPVYSRELEKSPLSVFAERSQKFIRSKDWGFQSIPFDAHRMSESAEGIAIDADPYAWHDYIHTSRIGAKVVSEDIAASLAAALKNSVQ